MATCLAASLAGCSGYSKVKQRRDSAVTVTGEQRRLTKSLKAISGPNQKLGHLLDSVQDIRERLAILPHDALLQADYNFAVARIVEIVEQQNYPLWDEPVPCPSAAGHTWSLTMQVPDPRPEYHPRHFELHPTDRYEFKGKLVGQRTRKIGIGAPVVVVGKDHDFTKFDQFAQGKQVFYGLTALVAMDGNACQIRWYDPLESEMVALDGREYNLGGDFQAPLALALAELDPKKAELSGMFRPDQHNYAARLARLQIYNPKKIPILCIHGLGNSPATWMPMIDFLRNDPIIREHYQFWFFSYPSGIPYPIVTAALRHKLDQFNERYPSHKDLVVIGHSMGGMISRLLITDSGMKLWDAYFDMPPDKIPFREESRRTMTNILIFDAQPDIARVIFASASHRGSKDAVGFMGRVGAKIVGNPLEDDSINKDVIKYVRPEARSPEKRDRLPNSIELLDPDALFLKLVDELPIKPGIPYHSIIGDRGKGGNLDRTKPESSDGVVPYWSSHIEGAQSELIIPSGHWSNLHPLGMAEVKRILIKHIQ